MHPGSRRFGELARLFRRSAVLAALGAFLAATVGIPVPSASVKDLSKPFPCMHRLCGCMDAAQCWKGCCCFTDREKLAWAAAHGIAPPDFVVAAAHKSIDSEATCCDDHPRGSRDHKAHAKNSPGSKSSNLVIASAWRSCHGLAPNWTSLSAVSPPPDGVAWQFEWTEIGRVCRPSRAVTSQAYPPPLPPPRV